MSNFVDFRDEESTFRQKLISFADSSSLGFGDVIVRTFDLQTGLREEHTADGLHPDITGHQLLGNNIAEIVSRSMDMAN